MRLLGFGCMSWPNSRTGAVLRETDLTVPPSGQCRAGGGTANDVCGSGDSGDSRGACATTTPYTVIAPYPPWINQQVGG